jgi:hypothetical protein
MLLWWIFSVVFTIQMQRSYVCALSETHVKFKAKSKSAIFWDIRPCSSVEIHTSFGETYCRHLQARRLSQRGNQHDASRKSLLIPGFFLGLFFDPEYGGSTFLRNGGELLLNYMPEDSFLHSHQCENLKSSVRYNCPCASHWRRID